MQSGDIVEEEVQESGDLVTLTPVMMLTLHLICRALGLSYGEGNGNLLQYSCLENPRDRGASWAAVYGVAQSRTRLKRLRRRRRRAFLKLDCRGQTDGG